MILPMGVCLLLTVVLLSREPAARMGDTELKVAETTASIVGRQMEQ